MRASSIFFPEPESALLLQPHGFEALGDILYSRSSMILPSRSLHAYASGSFTGMSLRRPRPTAARRLAEQLFCFP
jgi:hypothetical protein